MTHSENVTLLIKDKNYGVQEELREETIHILGNYTILFLL